MNSNFEYSQDSWELAVVCCWGGVRLASKIYKILNNNSFSSDIPNKFLYHFSIGKNLKGMDSICAESRNILHRLVLESSSPSYREGVSLFWHSLEENIKRYWSLTTDQKVAASRQCLRRFSSTFLHFALNRNLTPEIIQATLEELMFAFQHPESLQNQIFSPFGEETFRHFDQSEKKFSLGISPFDDNELNGGVLPGSLIMISGPTNSGKTFLCLKIALHFALHKFPILYLSAEDGPSVIAKRVWALLLNLPVSKITNEIAEKAFSESRQAFDLLKKYFRAGCLQHSQMNPDSICDLVDYTSEPERPVLIVIDYLQKIVGSNYFAKSHLKRDEELEMTVNCFRDYCRTNDTCILLASQTTSSASNGESPIIFARESAARSYAATWGSDYIITIQRTQSETMRMASSKDKTQILNLFLAKNKHGPLGACQAKFHPSSSTFSFHRNITLNSNNANNERQNKYD